MTPGSLVGDPGPLVWMLVAVAAGCAILALRDRSAVRAVVAPRRAVPPAPPAPSPTLASPTPGVPGPGAGAGDGEVRLDDVAAGTFPMLMAVMDLKDRYTGRHSLSVGRLCRMVATELDWSETDRALCHITGLLHDIGKIGVPDAVLRKPGAPTPHEWALLRRHPDWGADALAQLPLADAVIDGVRCHHERWDGSGYPRGLAGEDIPSMGRVVALCDSFHAMISMRPFRPALSMEAALAEIDGQAGGLFDPAMAAALLRVLADVDPLELIVVGDDFAAEWRRACAGIAPETLYAESRPVAVSAGAASDRRG